MPWSPHETELGGAMYEDMVMREVKGAVGLGEVLAMQAAGNGHGKPPPPDLGVFEGLDLMGDAAIDAIFDRLGEIDDAVFVRGLQTEARGDQEADVFEGLPPDDEEQFAQAQASESDSDADSDWARIQHEMNAAKTRPDPYEEEFTDLTSAPKAYSYTKTQRRIISDLRTRLATTEEGLEDNEDDTPPSVHGTVAGLQFSFSTSAPRRAIEGDRARVMEAEIEALRKMMGVGPKEQ
eukprot:TRINITY_DN17497_c0_g1_i1.p1 TRINITY_DN17497_c0_g1~~TRINITY_DN17497_c0_g1_i1.p1  ORF type:complete len:236 (+),score=40.04 TRINITY_DN17497_c0_g1_i1:43-750(+)